MAPHTLLLLFLLFILLFIVFNFLSLFLPPTQFQLWVNRPVRALIAAWRFKVSYQDAYLVFFISDRQLRDDLAEERKKHLALLAEERKKRLALLACQRYPEHDKHSMVVFQKLFLRDK